MCVHVWYVWCVWCVCVVYAMVFVECVRCVWFEQMDRTVFFTSVNSLPLPVGDRYPGSNRENFMCAICAPSRGGIGGIPPQKILGILDILRSVLVHFGTFIIPSHQVQLCRVLYIMYISYFRYSNYPINSELICACGLALATASTSYTCPSTHAITAVLLSASDLIPTPQSSSGPGAGTKVSIHSGSVASCTKSVAVTE